MSRTWRRRSTPARHTGKVLIAFDDLIDLLTRGVVSPTFVGTYTFIDPDGVKRQWRVWRRGRLARIEDPPGTTRLIAGESQYWWKNPIGGEVVVKERSPDYDDFELSEFTWQEPEKYWRDWLSQDRSLVLGTLRSVVVEGRPAWEFTAPFVKGASSLIAVDAELGLMLRAERDDVGRYLSWTEVRTDLPDDDDLFRH